MPVWIRAPKSGQEYYTGLSCAKLYELAGRGVIRSFSLRDPGSIKGSRFFHLQSVLDYLERAEKKEAKYADVSTDAEATPPTPPPPPLKGRTVFLANTLTGGGHEYLIGVFASESDAWLGAQREVRRGDFFQFSPQQTDLLGIRRKHSGRELFLLGLAKLKAAQKICNRLRFVRVCVTGHVLFRPDFLKPFLLLDPWEIDPNDSATGNLKIVRDVPQSQRMANGRLGRTGFIHRGILDLAFIEDLGDESPNIGMHKHHPARETGCGTV